MNALPPARLWMLMAVGLAVSGLAGESAGTTGALLRLQLKSPYHFGGHQHKVQLHAHTTHSDGKHPGEWVMHAYQKLGYAAVAITDHDYTRCTASLADPKGHRILHIPGVEYSGDDRQASWNHMLGIHLRTIHHTDGTGARQAQIDQAKREGGLTFLCHPYDESVHRRGWDARDILELVKGYHGMEIHNGSSYHAPGGRDYPYKVDLALMAGRRITVIATDDFHSSPKGSMDRGHVVINSDRDAESLRLEDVVSALASGNFFAAGRLNTAHPAAPRFTDIAVNGNVITVTTDKETDIEFITHRFNYHRPGRKYAQKDEGVTSARFIASPEDRFIRIKATLAVNGNSSYAWSNPIYCEPE